MELRELLREEGKFGVPVLDEFIEDGLVSGGQAPPISLQAFAFNVIEELILAGPGLLDLSLLCGDQVVNWVVLIWVLHDGWSW